MSGPPAQPGRWQARHHQLDAERRKEQVSPGDCRNEIARRLGMLASRGHCEYAAPAWLQVKKNQRLGHRSVRSLCTFSDRADGKAGKHPGLALRRLSYLDDGAVLTVCVDIDERTERLLSYNLGLCGTSQSGTRRWYARVDLHEELAADLAASALGYCSHPLFHCHVGADPEDSDEVPSVRVPLPWLMPWDALEWLLATVEPQLDPEPLSHAESSPCEPRPRS